MPKGKYHVLLDKDLRRYLHGPDKTYADGESLYLRVRGNKGSWVYRYADANGKVHDFSLGSYRPDTPSHSRHVTLQQARAKALQQKQLREQGLDPVEVRAALRVTVRAKIERGNLPTFQRCYEDWVETRQHKFNWSYKYRTDTDSSTRRHIYPVVGDLPISEVTRAHVDDILRPIWHRVPDEAERVRSRLEQVLDRAANLDQREGDNPATLARVSIRLGDQKKRTKNHARVEPEDVPGLMKLLRRVDRVPARCAEAVILSGMRSSNIRLAHWESVDEDAGVLVIPRRGPGIEELRALKRDIGQCDFRVPLTPRLREIIEEMKQHRRNDYIFPGVNVNSVNKGALNTAVYPLIPHKAITIHGFRSSFRDWAGALVGEDGRALFEHEVCEIAIAHNVGDKTTRAYNRDDWLMRRKPLMEMWDAYCCSMTLDR